MFMRRHTGPWVLALVFVATTFEVTHTGLHGHFYSHGLLQILDVQDSDHGSERDDLRFLERWDRDDQSFRAHECVRRRSRHLSLGNPRPVEDKAPAVLFSQFALDRTLTFSTPVTTFGVEMESNNPTNPFTHPTFTLTATFFDGTDVVGTISQKLKAPAEPTCSRPRRRRAPSPAWSSPRHPVPGASWWARFATRPSCPSRPAWSCWAWVPQESSVTSGFVVVPAVQAEPDVARLGHEARPGWRSRGFRDRPVCRELTVALTAWDKTPILSSTFPYKTGALSHVRVSA